MRTVQWIGAGVAVTAAVLAAIIAAAAPGDILYATPGTPIVLSAGQRTNVRNWLQAEPAVTITPANIDKLKCHRPIVLESDATGRRVGVSVGSAWSCTACDVAVLTDDQLYAAAIQGVTVADDGTVSRCVDFAPTQLSSMATAILPLVSPAPVTNDMSMVVEFLVARTPRVANHVTATATPIVSRTPAQWRDEWRRGAVLVTLGRVP